LDDHGGVRARARAQASPRGLSVGLETANLRVEQIAESVSDEVEAKDRQHDGGAGIEDEPRHLLDVEPSLCENAGRFYGLMWAPILALRPVLTEHPTSFEECGVGNAFDLL
jgi:hypothetical protein